MQDGVLKAIEVAKQAAHTREVHAVGYCVGGTMLAITLAWLAAARRKVGIRSASFLTTQVDFSQAGDLKVFIDEEQIANLERKMLETGVMEGRKMANAFNMLRANDLIWPYVVNNYLKGQAPFPFDMLYWNSDSTRLPAANHSFYLRNCYLDNRLATGELELAGRKLDLSQITLPTYCLATREDHIAPGAFGVPRHAAVRHGYPLRAGGIRAHCRRHQPAGARQVPVLDRRGAERDDRELDRQGGDACRLLVAGLDRLDPAAGQPRSAGARARRRAVRPDRGRAGELCEGAGLRRCAAFVSILRGSLRSHLRMTVVLIIATTSSWRCPARPGLEGC